MIKSTYRLIGSVHCAPIGGDEKELLDAIDRLMSRHKISQLNILRTPDIRAPEYVVISHDLEGLT